MEGGECCSNSGRKTRVVPDYLLVDPQAVSLGFSMKVIQQERGNGLPVDVTALQLILTRFEHLIVEGRIQLLLSG